MITLGNNIETYLLIIGFAAILGILIAIDLIYSFTKGKKQKEKTQKELEEPFEDFQIDETSVRVLKKYCFTEVYGYKKTEMRKSFFIIFETDDGQKIECEVLEDIYLSIQENQRGTLATTNGNFFGFCEN